MRSRLRRALVLLSILALATACAREGGPRAPSPPGSPSAAPEVKATASAEPAASAAPLASAAPAAGEAAAPEAVAAGLRGDAEVRQWNAVPGGAVVLQVDEAAVKPDGARAKITLAVVERDGASFRRLAQTTATLDHEGCGDATGASMTGAPSITLDLAPYRLDSKNVAVGVRFACERVFPAGEGSETWLHLFRVDGESLWPVLEVSVQSADHQRGPGEDIETDGTVIMNPRRGAFADITVKRTTIVRPIEGATGKEQKRTSTERYLWEGGRYHLESKGKRARRP